MNGLPSEVLAAALRDLADDPDLRRKPAYWRGHREARWPALTWEEPARVLREAADRLEQDTKEGT